MGEKLAYTGEETGGSNATMNNPRVMSGWDWTEILEITVCNKCKKSLSLIENPSGKALYCGSCDTRYPIKNGIIFMLKENNHSFKTKKDWNNAAKVNHIKVAAAISKECVESPFVKLDPLPSEEELRNKVYLDLDCGYGRTLIPCAKGGTKISIGIDISTVMLERAVDLCRQYETNCILVNGDIADMPFQDNSFDIIYSSAVMLHLDMNITKIVIKEVRRILKPSGKVIFHGSFPNKLHLWRLPSLPIYFASLIKQHICHYYPETRVRYYTYSQVIHLFEGFSWVKVFSLHYQLIPKNVWVFRVPFRSKVKSVNERFSKKMRLKYDKKCCRLLNPLAVHFDVEAAL